MSPRISAQKCNELDCINFLVVAHQQYSCLEASWMQTRKEDSLLGFDRGLPVAEGNPGLLTKTNCVTPIFVKFLENV